MVGMANLSEQHSPLQSMAHYHALSATSAVNPNLLVGELHVKINVSRFAGMPQETTQWHTVILKRDSEKVEVCRIDHDQASLFPHRH
jgi:hypothetical protein